MVFDDVARFLLILIGLYGFVIFVSFVLRLDDLYDGYDVDYLLLSLIDLWYL